MNVAMGKDVCRGKVAYIWISPDLTKVGPTLGGGGGDWVSMNVACFYTMKNTSG